MGNCLQNFSLNKAAVDMVEKLLLPNQEQLRIKHIVQSNGCNLIDMGVKVPGSFLAGKYFTEISLCGLGEMKLTTMKVGEYRIPAVSVTADFPTIAEMCSHVAFLRVKQDGVAKNFSGPVRSKVKDAFSNAVDYSDVEAEKVVAGFQVDEIPPESFTSKVAEAAQVKPENLYIMIARTGSVVGSIQVTARNIEQTLPTLFDKGFNLENIQYASAITPVNAIVYDEMEAYGRVNDCLIYGQETTLHADCEDIEITSILKDLTMNQAFNQDVFGVPFKEIFAMCENDWCKVPRSWDAPCKINFYNRRTGNYFSTGEIGVPVLTEGFMGKGGKRVK